MKNKIFKILSKTYHTLEVYLLRFVARIRVKKLDIDRMDNVLVISPHPDDEVFGCGSLMQQLKEKGKSVYLIILSKGEGVHKHCCPGDDNIVVEERHKLTIKANRELGVEEQNIEVLDYPDGGLKNIINDQYYINELKERIDKIKPTEVFLPHPYENSPDHEAATDIIENILVSYNVNKYYYCVWTWYHMFITKIFKLNYKKAYLLKQNDNSRKDKAIDIYVNNKAKCGVSYSGDLPKPFIKAFRWKYELFFKG